MKNTIKHLLTSSVLFVAVVSLANISGHYVKTHPSGGFPYAEYAARAKLPDFLRFLTNFDGTQYLIIAESGYFTYQQAYFPLYPLLASVFGRYLLLGNTPVALILISFVSFVTSLWLLSKIFADQEFEGININPYLILLLPGSFFFVSAYTESLFLVLFLGSIWLVRRYSFLGAFATGVALGLTRLVGVFTTLSLLLIVFDVIGRKNHDKQGISPPPPLAGSRDDEKGVAVAGSHQSLSGLARYNTNPYLKSFVVFSPLLGLLVYMAYLYGTTGDPFAFISSQKAFNNARSTTSIVLLPQVVYRYLKIILTVRTFDVVYLVSVIELVVFTIYAWLLTLEGFFLWREWRSGRKYYRLRTALLAFSVVNIILPTLTGTFSSIPRYGLMSLSVIPAFFALNKYLRLALPLLLLTINIVMLMLFTRGWFVS